MYVSPCSGNGGELKERRGMSLRFELKFVPAKRSKVRSGELLKLSVPELNVRMVL